MGIRRVPSFGVLVFFRELTSLRYTIAADGSDHTIVSSDSLGSVTFWDGTSLAQKQSFQAHKADGMCMAIGPVSHEGLIYVER